MHRKTLRRIEVKRSIDKHRNDLFFEKLRDVPLLETFNRNSTEQLHSLRASSANSKQSKYKNPQ